MTKSAPYSSKAVSPEEKYGGLKSLILTAQEDPAKLYPEFDKWREMLDDQNSFVKWTGIDIIGNLSRVDRKNKIGDEVLHSLFNLLKAGKMITANHAVYALGLIALFKPKYKDQIIKTLTRVSRFNYESPECRNIVTGKVILALSDLKEDIKTNKQALSFIKAACSNSRNATKKKAESLLKKLLKPS